MSYPFLQGAIPAAMLALLIHGFFEIVDQIVITRGLKIKIS